MNAKKKRKYIYNSNLAEFSKEELTQLSNKAISKMYNFVIKGMHIECEHTIEINPVIDVNVRRWCGFFSL